MPLHVGLLMGRRKLFSIFIQCGGLLLLAPFVNKLRITSDNDFIIVDGWVLRADDVRRKS